MTTKKENVQRPTSNAQCPTSEFTFESTALGGPFSVEAFDVGRWTLDVPRLLAE
jgi:hypothetical protein